MFVGSSREDIEAEAEAALLAVAESLVGDPQGTSGSPGKDAPKFARDYQPYFFGGKFPAIGVDVVRSEGDSRYADMPHLPGTLVAQVMVYQPALPARGAHNAKDDRTGPAKRNTRRIRGLFLAALFDERQPLSDHVRVVESRGGSYDDVGNPVFDERAQNLLFVDRTELEIRI